MPRENPKRDLSREMVGGPPTLPVDDRLRPSRHSRCVIRFFCILCVVLAPLSAGAHSVERGLIQLLPTELWLRGGAAAVLVSFLALAVMPRQLPKRIFQARLRLPALRFGGGRTVQWLAALAFAGLVMVGFWGPRDPLENFAVLGVWTLFWIGFPALVALFGDLWRWFNPWSAPLALIGGGGRRPIPTWLGYWPAIAGFGAIIWFDLVYPSPRDPEHLAWAMLGYWGIQFVAQAVFGEAWRERGEAFSVFLALIARLSPFSGGLRVPGSAVAGASALPVSGWLFVTLAIAGITADGLGGTFWWLGKIGINPLSYPGRTVMMEASSLGLAGVWFALAVAYSAVVWMGWRLAGRAGSLGTAMGRLALSLIPIALAYHLAHFLTHFLVNGQYALAALSDPFHMGADFLGFTERDVTTSFLNTIEGIRTIWIVQVSLIVGGHLLAVLIAHAIAVDLFGRRAQLAGLPLALLMVGMTLLGLWLLSTPTGA